MSVNEIMIFKRIQLGEHLATNEVNWYEICNLISYKGTSYSNRVSQKLRWAEALQSVIVCIKIVESFKHNVPQCQISNALQISSSSLHNIIKRVRETGDNISVHKEQGWNSLLDVCGLRALRRHFITHWHDCVNDVTKWLQEYFQKPLSVNTIHRAICRYQLKLYHAKRKPYLNIVQKHHRVLWAKTHLKWTVSKWECVLWSDEFKFDILVGNHGRRVLRTKKEGDHPACYQSSVQKPASLMV